MKDFEIPKGLIKEVEVTANNPISKGAFSLRKILRSILTWFNIPFYDKCCPTPNDSLPLRYNATIDAEQYYDPTTDTWVDTGGGAFIPLAGTNVNAPVTGNIEVIPATEIFANVLNYDTVPAGVPDGQTVIKLQNNQLVVGRTNGNGLIVGLFIATNGIQVIDQIDARGIFGESYYGATAVNNDYVQKKYVDDALTAIGGTSSLIYKAVLTPQPPDPDPNIEPGPPTMTIFENTVGTIVWTKEVGTDDFLGTLVGAFPADKILAFVTGETIAAQGGGSKQYQWISADQIRIIGNSGSGLITPIHISIAIYP